MTDINLRSDSVDVDEIMRQIRARIREKRGVDYTETELQDLASVKLQQFLDPSGVRSDLVEQFRRHQPPTSALPNYVFEDTTLFETHRGPLRIVRRLLRPVLKLFFNPNKISDALHIQAEFNQEMQRQIWQRGQMEPLYYEVIHNLVVELTRLGIDVQNLKMRVDSLTSRMDFDERRAKALESVVEYKPPTARRHEPRPSGERPSGDRPAGGRPGGDRPAGDRPAAAGDRPAGDRPGQPAGPPGETAGDAERRRRRRRRRRRPGRTGADEGGRAPESGESGGAPSDAAGPAEAPERSAGENRREDAPANGREGGDGNGNGGSSDTNGGPGGGEGAAGQ